VEVTLHARQWPHAASGRQAPMQQRARRCDAPDVLRPALRERSNTVTG